MCLNFIVLNFFVSFFSDLVLNILSRFKKSPAAIRALKSYFTYYDSPILTAVYAGFTVISVLVITILFSFFILGFTEPHNKKQLLKFIELVNAGTGYGGMPSQSGDSPPRVARLEMTGGA